MKRGRRRKIEKQWRQLRAELADELAEARDELAENVEELLERARERYDRGSRDLTRATEVSAEVAQRNPVASAVGGLLLVAAAVAAVRWFTRGG